MTVGELAELARQAQSGDEAARDELLAELYSSVRKHIHLVLGSRALVEDAVQETMIALHLGLPRFRGDASPRTWALTIATRVAHKLRAWEARYDLDKDDMADTSVFDCGPAEAAEFALLQRALAKLTAKKRDAFVLMEIFELSAEEAGRVLEVPANTAASQNRHACAELKARFKRMDAPTCLDVSRTPGAVEP